MRLWREIRFRFRALFFKRALEAEMAEEISQHLERLEASGLAAGLTPKEARLAALKQFGGVEQLKETARDQRGVSAIEHLVSDFTYGLRQLRKTPGFAVIAILTVAIGIGATTAIFSVVNAVVLRPLAYPQPEQLVSVAEAGAPDFVLQRVTPATFFELRHSARLFQSFTAWEQNFANITGLAFAQRRLVRSVASNYLAIHGISPLFGRDFQPGDDAPGAVRVAILGHEFWSTEFRAQPDILGRTLQLDGQPCTVVGIMPPGFPIGGAVDVFIPAVYTEADRVDHTAHRMTVLGRLQPGITLEAARADLAAVSALLAQKYPDTHAHRELRASLFGENVVISVRKPLFLLFAAVGFLLLIACTNVANLLLARATTREREIAVRVSLGAGRVRILRQLLCESLLITVIGGALGVLLAYGGLHALRAFIPFGVLPRVTEIALDGRALGFATVVSFLTGLAFGLTPALHASRVNLHQALKIGAITTGRTVLRLRAALVVGEIALALILLTGSGLLIRSLAAARGVDPGFQYDRVYYTGLQLPPALGSDPAQQIAAAALMVQGFAGRPGVQSAAIFGSNQVGRVFLPGAPASPVPATAPPRTLTCAITTGYFSTLGVPLLRGRAFDARDTADADPVAIIDTELARQYLPNQDPLGQRIRFSGNDQPWVTIVGIVGHAHLRFDEVTPLGMLYRPLTQRPAGALVLLINSTRDRTAVAAAIRSVITASGLDLAPGYVHPMSDWLAAPLGLRRFLTLIVSVFSGTALLLSAVGLYGVMAYTVSQRTNEIGLRLALGAGRGDIVRLVFISCSRLLALGLLLGLGGALALTQLLAFLLFRVSAYDPTTLAFVVLLLALVAVLATWLPARRATAVQPITALRCE